MELPVIFSICSFALALICAWGLTIVALKNWRGDRYLCDNCQFNNETDCLQPERGRALRCTAYRDGERHNQYEF